MAPKRDDLFAGYHAEMATRMDLGTLVVKVLYNIGVACIVFLCFVYYHSRNTLD
jgi:hypothetical protein